VVASAAPFLNDSLRNAEHATLLWDFVKKQEVERVWFVYSSDISFWTLLWDYGSLALLSLGVLVGIWVWYVVPRFGPQFVTVSSEENKLESHLVVTGDFYTRHAADQLVIDQVIEGLTKTLARRVHLPINTPLAEILERCDDVLTPQQRTILTTPVPRDGKERVSYLHELQQLQSTL